MGYYVYKVESAIEVFRILSQFSGCFNPPLTDIISDMNGYAIKLINNGSVYAAKLDCRIVGFVAFYSNNQDTKIGYLTQIAAEKNSGIKELGYVLLQVFEEECKKCGMEVFKLEVNKDNSKAIMFYLKNNYKFSEQSTTNTRFMIKEIGGEAAKLDVF